MPKIQELAKSPFLRMGLTKSHQKLKPLRQKIRLLVRPHLPHKLFQIRLPERLYLFNQNLSFSAHLQFSNHPSDFCAFMDCFRLKASLRAAALISLDFASAPAEMLAMVAWFSDCSTEICCTTR